MPQEGPAEELAPASEQAGAPRSAFSNLFRRDMDRNEQLTTLAAALLALLGGIGLFVSVLVEHHHPKGQEPAWAYLVRFVVFGVALVLAVRRRSRVITSIVAMAGSLFVLGGTILGLPYIGLAGWLLIRNSRAVREERLASGATRPTRERQPRPARVGRAGRRRAEPAPPPVRRSTSSNKRYTPPGGRRSR